MKLPRRARVKIIASLAGCHHDRLGKFRTCVSTLFPKVKVAANSRCSLELFLFDTIFLPPYPFPAQQHRNKGFPRDEIFLAKNISSAGKRYIYIHVRFLDDRVPIHDGGTDRCGIQATSRRSRHKERVDAREKGERERERKKRRRKRGRDNSVYNEGGIQIPAVPSGNERLTGTKGRKKKEKRISSWREDERRGEEGVKRAQRGRQGNISQSSKSWGHHEWVLEEGGENGI